MLRNVPHAIPAWKHPARKLGLRKPDALAGYNYATYWLSNGRKIWLKLHKLLIIRP